jgi:hypothetical protein
MLLRPRVTPRKHTKALKAAAALLLASAAALLLAELGLRWALFGGSERFAGLRRAGRYAVPDTEDFWKLDHALGARFPPPEHPHPVLGWVGRFSPATYRHDDEASLAGRRPVLLYGDSFASCSPQARCFEELLNGDPEFAAGHYLLNYGVGGYGVDQILLLVQRTLDLYERPFVVLSVMTLDLDRSALTVRTGQKPRFALRAGELVPDGPPIERDAAAFFDAHPPEIRSYVWRGVLFSRLVPRRVADWVTGERARVAQLEALNAALLRALLDEVRRRGLDCACVVFHPDAPGLCTLAGPEDWRDPFLRELLQGAGVPLIWSRDLLPPDEELDASLYILPEDGHPTTLFNTLVARAIKAAVTGR